MPWSHRSREGKKDGTSRIRRDRAGFLKRLSDAAIVGEVSRPGVRQHETDDLICPDARGGLINRVDRAYEERKGFRSENLASRADIEYSMPMPVALVRNVPNEASEREYYCID